jgi:16S rRNA (adenine1518-N6/adenine1519-N6)-dimethyltransferase
MAEKFRTKKSLGQHFLKSTQALEKMVSAGDVSKKDTVVEIGPGEGILTSVLLSRGAHVIAIEKDDRLIPILQEKFATEIKNKKLTLVHDDVLLFSPKKFNLKAGSYKLIANIPYYITGLILRTFLESDFPPNTAVLLVQKEVAKRMAAKEESESLLSISVKVFGTPAYIHTVPRGAFSPPPKVDSAIIAISNIRKILKKERERFFDIVRAGFAHPRKRLVKNLEKIAENKELLSVWEKLTLSENVRAEEVPLETWENIARLLKK